MDINKLIPDEEVELTEILVEKEAALSSDPNEVPEYRYSKVEDKLAKLSKNDMTESADAMKAGLFKDAVSDSGVFAPKMGKVTIVNNTSKGIGLGGYGIKEVNGTYYSVYNALSVKANSTSDIPVLLPGGAVGTQYSTPYEARWFCHLTTNNSAVDPTKVVAVSNIGTVRLVREAEADSSPLSAFILDIGVSGRQTATEQVVITISVSA